MGRDGNQVVKRRWGEELILLCYIALLYTSHACTIWQTSSCWYSILQPDPSSQRYSICAVWTMWIFGKTFLTKLNCCFVYKILIWCHYSLSMSTINCSDNIWETCLGSGCVGRSMHSKSSCAVICVHLQNPEVCTVVNIVNAPCSVINERPAWGVWQIHDKTGHSFKLCFDVGLLIHLLSIDSKIWCTDLSLYS